jgi:DNA-binding LytR/AlgR family response regulator
MNCLIIDDDVISRKSIQLCVERTDSLTLAGNCASIKEALKVMKKHAVDLIFLDIEMPEISGIDFIKNFQFGGQIIIISSKKDYAAESYDYNVTDYIVKPLEYARFLKAVMKAQDIQGNVMVNNADSDDIFIKKDSRLIKLSAKDIIWVEALADYVNIHMENSVRHTVLSTMKSIEDKLSKKDFVRIHRSYLIRLDKIKSIEENAVALPDKVVLPISRSHKDDLLTRLKLI